MADGRAAKVLSDRDPANLPWGELGVDVVVEATGIFKTGELAQKHLDAGAKKVVITCNQDEDITIVMGVNDDQYDPPPGGAQHHLERLLHHQLPLAPFAKVLLGELRHQARLRTPSIPTTTRRSSIFPIKICAAPALPLCL